MSNSNGRQRAGFPPQRPAPADGRRHDPQHPHDEPALSWPPAQPQHPQHPPQGTSWGHDEHGSGQAAADGYHNGHEWQQPQHGYPQAPHGHDTYTDPYGRAVGGQPQAPYPEDAFAPPPAQGHENRGYDAPPEQGGQGSPYAAQFEAYVPPSVAPDPNTGRPVFGNGYGAPQAEPQLRGSNHEDGWPSTQPSQGGYARGDAGHYPQQPSYHPDPRYAQEPQPYPGDQWGEAGIAGADGGYPAGAYPADPYAYPTDQYGQPVDPALVAGAQHVAVNEEYDDYDEEYDAEDEPQSGRSRLMMIVGGLVGAVVVGAGLAYGYKTFGVGGIDVAGGPPVVRGDGLANKARPDNPGGRKFDHTDSKVMQRISRDGRASTNADGSRRVSTMMIGRDGRVVETGKPSEPAGSAPSQPVVSVPGLTVVDGFAGQRAAQQAARSQAGGPIVVSPPKATANALSPVRPVSITEPPKSLPAVSPPPKAPNKVAVVTPPPRSVPVAKTRPKPPAAPRSAPTAGGKGYVAVLASVPVSATSRLDALKTFADIQQNYGKVLNNRTPDVREANLGAKGNYHRLMVGPPSSRESANALCKELKSAGYPSCWITSY